MTTMGNIDLNIPTESARNEKRSRIAKFVGGAALVGLLAYAIPVGYQELAERRHAKRVQDYISQNNAAKAVLSFDKYRIAGTLDEEDVARLSPIIDGQRTLVQQTEEKQHKQQILINLEAAVKNFEYAKAQDMLSSARSENTFTDAEKTKLESIASNFGDESHLYNAILTADESRLANLTDTYIAQFPNGAHRDSVITQWLVLAYRNTEKKIAASDATTTFTALSDMIQQLERAWPSMPQHNELLYAKAGLRNTLDKRLKEPLTSGDVTTPGTFVRVVKNDPNSWSERYLTKRSVAIAIGTLGTVEDRSLEPGSVCVKIPTFTNTADYKNSKCDIETAANLASFKSHELEPAYFNINERSRLTLLSSDLIAAEKHYFSAPQAQEE